MLRFSDIVFGPIHSRRLGSSLGVNLLPKNGKLCNFDCIYCECGTNAEGRGDTVLPSADDVREAMRAKLLELRECSAGVDSITFSGTGEPTLHPQFASIVKDTVTLRDELFPSARISVLSNATTLHRDDVVQALKMVDNPILKLDAPTNRLAAMIDRPHPSYDVERVATGMLRFDGDFVLQTMMLSGAGFDFETDRAALAGWMDIVRRVHPRLVMVYTLDRPAPFDNISKKSREAMEALVQPLVAEGFNVQING